MHYIDDGDVPECPEIYDSQLAADLGERGWAIRLRRDAIGHRLPSGRRLPTNIPSERFLQELVAGFLLRPEIASDLAAVVREVMPDIEGVAAGPAGEWSEAEKERFLASIISDPDFRSAVRAAIREGSAA